VFPADCYFNPMGDGEDPVAPIEPRALLANHARPPVWLFCVFSVRIDADVVNCATHFRSSDPHHLDQELSLAVLKGYLVLYDGDGLIVVPALDSTEDYSVFCEVSAQIVLIKSLRRIEPLCPGMDPLFAFCTALVVGELGMHFVLDLRIGRTVAFRIEHRETGPGFLALAAIDSICQPESCVSDRYGLVATFSDVNMISQFKRVSTCSQL
jgi:hypothetical protein